MKKLHGAYRVAFLGILLSLALILAILEGFIPTLPFLPPGVKLGLSNIVTMYSLYFLGFYQAIIIAILKSLFVFITRGFTSSLLSFLGGIISIIVMSILCKVKDLSPMFCAIGGAISHNLGQLIGASIILKNGFTFYYAPILVLSGVVMGSITGILLKIVLPSLNRVREACNK